jgi:hypothetical protein
MLLRDLRMWHAGNDELDPAKRGRCSRSRISRGGIGRCDRFLQRRRPVLTKLRVPVTARYRETLRLPRVAS